MKNVQHAFAAVIAVACLEARGCVSQGARCSSGALELHKVGTNRATTYCADSFGLASYSLHMSIPWCSVGAASIVPGSEGPTVLRLEIDPGSDIVMEMPEAWLPHVKLVERMEPRVLEFTFEEPIGPVLAMHEAARCDR